MTSQTPILCNAALVRKQPSTPEEFLILGVAQTLNTLAPSAITQFVAKHSYEWERKKDDRLLADVVKSQGKALQDLMRPHYPSIVGMDQEVFDQLDCMIGYGGITQMLDSISLGVFYDQYSLRLSQAISYNDGNHSSGDVCRFVANIIFNNPELEQIKAGGLKDGDLDTVLLNLIQVDGFDDLDPNRIEYLVKSNAVRWLS